MERKIYYSETERAFLFSDVHGPKEYEVADEETGDVVTLRNPRYPSDAVEVSEADYAALMAAQAAPNWSTIEPDESGAPQVVPASDERLAGFVRMERDERLTASDVLVLQDRWASYTPEEQVAVAAYRQALRDLPDQPGFPRNVTWPEAPA